MIEISNIIIALLLFLIIIFVPINIFDSKNKIFINCSSLDIASFNLIINCTILLIFSLLPFALENYNHIYYAILALVFIYSYFLKVKNYKIFKKIILNFLIFSIIFLIISIDVAAKLKLGWDAQFFYYIKALFFVEGQTFYDLNNFKYGFHPHLGTYFWSFYWKFININLEYTGRLFYVFISCFSFFYICKNNFETNNFKIVTFLLLVLFFYEYERFSGLQEILIFSFIVLLSKYLMKILETRNILFSIFFAMTCNLILWIKAEGIVYLSIMFIIFNLSSKIRAKEKIYISLFLVFMIFFKYVIYEISQNDMLDKSGHPYDFSYFEILNLNFILYKLKLIIPYLIYYTLNNMFLIFGIIILIYNKCYNLNTEYNNSVLMYFLLTTCFIFSAYLFRNMEIEYSIKTTMERITFTVSGFYLMILVNFLNDIFNKFKEKKFKS
jgi:hypothetical protein